MTPLLSCSLYLSSWFAITVVAVLRFTVDGDVTHKYWVDCGVLSAMETLFKALVRAPAFQRDCP